MVKFDALYTVALGACLRMPPFNGSNATQGDIIRSEEELEELTLLTLVAVIGLDDHATKRDVPKLPRIC